MVDNKQGFLNLVEYKHTNIALKNKVL